MKKHLKLVMIKQQNVYKRTFVHCVWNNSQRRRCVNIINLIITGGEILQSTHNTVSINPQAPQLTIKLVWQ